MPESEPIVILEKQVHRLLETVKRLKGDNVQLQERVREFRQQLTTKKTEENRWVSEKTRVEAKVRKLISDLDTMARSHVQD
jgi:predicted RNase H-like nuclease (RuvC/YqgF family)